MSSSVFGIDFGTTNSLAALVVGNEVQALTGEIDDKPHPSVVWYRGSEVVVGREARKHIESLAGSVVQGFVRSPKTLLRREGPIHVDGRAIEPVDIVAEVLRYLRTSASTRRGQGYDMSRAVITIPVDFAGSQRRLLRAAARKAGIGVLQFVHEPAAALYAFLRARPDFDQHLAQLEGRVVLVFDWGGGTLDLTICRILGGAVLQVANRGNNEIGGDQFDERLRNEIRTRHSAQHGISDVSVLEQPSSAAVLLTQCEQAKIGLSSASKFTVLAKDYLRAPGRERNLAVDFTREDLEQLASDLVNRGLGEIDRLLEQAQLDRSDVELCLATGGMVNMPAIWNGLVERFGARVPRLPNRDRIIAEGAAWIANDNLRLTLAKPVELLVADGSGRGSHLPIVDAGFHLPVENQTIAAGVKRLFCIDPRDGIAVFEFTKPRKVGLLTPSDERTTLCSVNLPVDPNARPFLERLECEVQIDDNYIAHVTLESKGTGKIVDAEFHDLEFGLALPKGRAGSGKKDGTDKADGVGDAKAPKKRRAKPGSDRSGTKIALRSNVSDIERWSLVPGDIVEQWKENFLAKYSREASDSQREEKMYYAPCAYCHRSIYEISRHGPVDACSRHLCGEGKSHLKGARLSIELKSRDDLPSDGSY